MSQREIEVHVSSLFDALCSDLDIHESTRSYCQRRLKNEGIKFLTVTLPKLGSAIVEALETGFFDRSSITCFRWKGSALAFFRELTDSIFDREGALLASPCVVAIYRVRQFTGYFYKLALEFSDEQLEVAENNFIKVDEEINANSHNAIFVDDVRKYIESRYAFPRTEEVLTTHRPRHGPGTYSQDNSYRERTRGNSYLEVKRSVHMHSIPKDFEGISGFFKPYPSCNVPLRFSDDSSQFSELLFVPKDSRGPRTIVREPLHKLRLQMAFFDWASGFFQKESHGRIQFTDQQVNQRLAQEGSRNGQWATLDLKEASDRVSRFVVKELFRNIAVMRYFVNSRTTHTVLPSGSTQELNKLSGMGSGLTFPILALIVHSAVVTSIANSPGPLFKRHEEIGRLVYVYGDDLIVPTNYVEHAIRGLEQVGLIVNRSKSFTAYDARLSGYFRESCGGDYYSGNDIGIVRARFASSDPVVSSNGILSLHGDSAVVQINAHAKELVLHGMNSLARTWETCLSKVVGLLPTITNFKSTVIGKYSTVFSSCYLPDANGNYPLLRVAQPVGALVESDAECPYIRLGDRLDVRNVDDGVSHLQEASAIVPAGKLPVPREIRLVYRRVSTLSLQG